MKVYNNKANIYTCPGDAFRIEFVKDFDESGNPILIENGKTDLQKLYDSYLPECDLSIIIKALTENGNPSPIFDDGIDDNRQITFR